MTLEVSLADRGIFWGKLRDNGARFLPLAQHCLDVAAVFRQLVALGSIHRRLAQAAGQPLTSTQLDRLAVLALLHDLGKANLGFQDKPFDPRSPQPGHVREVAPLFCEADLAAQLNQALDLPTLTTWFGNETTLLGYLFAFLSHHGRPVNKNEFGPGTQNYHHARTRWWRPDATRDPIAALTELMTTAKKAFPGAFEEQAPAVPDSPALQHRFAGLLMLADWLGSDDQFFPIDNGGSDRFKLAPRQAARAVRAVGLEAASWQSFLAGADWSFQSLFGFSPHPLQAALDHLPTVDSSNRLLIAEAETGSGKTEAALIRFLRLFSDGQVDGLYFALPTRVAARELYRRVADCVERVFRNPEDRPPVLLAVPGYARIDGVPLLPERAQASDDEPDQRRAERAWAAQHPKRFLAATIAVGTIDQALLSAIQSPHAHLRSVCLDRQLLVVDEVHASDNYMGYLLTELLRHHLQAGHALLLSATLGAHARSRFIGAAGGTQTSPDLATAESAPYPALTEAEGRLIDLDTTTQTYEKAVTVECLPHLEHPEVLLKRIAAALKRNARVLVVCNTVRQALTLQRAAEDLPEIPRHALFHYRGVVTPHHGRYAPEDREQLDGAVSARLGKQSSGGPVLLIGTQTLEQSLDIDTDLLITDLCPMDVLLQRIGRLHRHSRKLRPEEYERARCLLLVPQVETLEDWLMANGEAAGNARRLGLGSVYTDLRSIQRTWESLRDRPDISLPRDNRRLVERATHPQSLDSLRGERWDKHASSIEGGAIALNVRAHQIALARHYDKTFGTFSFSDLDNNARTRLGLNSLVLALPKPMTSPFGIEIREVMIPGHLAPQSSNPAVTVLTYNEGAFSFRVENRHFRYSRLGLELVPSGTPVT